jgi:hypothetical protein
VIFDQPENVPAAALDVPLLEIQVDQRHALRDDGVPVGDAFLEALDLLGGTRGLAV